MLACSNSHLKTVEFAQQLVVEGLRDVSNYALEDEQVVVERTVAVTTVLRLP